MLEAEHGFSIKKNKLHKGTVLGRYFPKLVELVMALSSTDPEIRSSALADLHRTPVSGNQKLLVWKKPTGNAAPRAVFREEYDEDKNVNYRLVFYDTHGEYDDIYGT